MAALELAGRGGDSVTPLDAAVRLIREGFSPIPVPFRQKRPVIDGWQKLDIRESDAQRYFNGAAMNIGCRMGFNGATDVDLDSPEAVIVAPRFLPITNRIFGRKSKRASHHIYWLDPPVPSHKFIDPLDKKITIVELRCLSTDGDIGMQTVFPPSAHKDTGESIVYEPGKDQAPANVEAAELGGAVRKIAAAALLAAHWPPSGGGRHDSLLALAGVLARGGWTEPDALVFCEAVYSAISGPSPEGRARVAGEVHDTFAKVRAGGAATGIPTLKGRIDERVVHRALDWLQIAQQATMHDRHEAPPPSKPARPKVAAMSPLGLEALMADDSIVTPELVIEGFLPKRGLVLLGGRPKEGKSWFACQTAISMSTGQALGRYLRVAEPGRVHVWALEDQLALTKDKMLKLLGGKHPDGLADIQIFDELPRPILDGGAEIVEATLAQYPAELVIFDSLFKLTGQKKPGADISQKDYDVIDRVRKIALKHNCVILIIMHTKKGARGGDPIENLIGTSGISAAADAACELKRKANRGTLTIVGRTVPHNDFQMNWHGGDAEGWGWSIEGDGEADNGETQDEVLAFLEAQGASKPTSIAVAVHKSFGAVWQALQRLYSRGKVTRGKDKRWELVR